jgi:hypothetical protein
MWVAVRELPKSVSHPFYEKLNELLAEHGFDEFVEAQCRQGVLCREDGAAEFGAGAVFSLSVAWLL